MIKAFNKGSLFTLFILLHSGFSISIQAQSIIPRNYYFDAKDGSDKNNGLDPAHPKQSLALIASLSFNPGDSILLKSGTIFLDSFFFEGRGKPGKPIVIGKYGGSKKPWIRGNASHLSMLHIYNSEYLVVRDIEISNKGKKIRPHLDGLLVELYNYGIAKNISIENLYIHDVYGSLIKGEGSKDKDAGGGQGMELRNLSGSEKDSIPSCFDGLLIQDCYIKNCQRNGIILWGNWVRKYWFPSRNVVIRRNIIDGIPGDGIVPVGCESPLVEYNIMKNSGSNIPPSEACDGIWPWSCDNATIQYNIVSGHKSKVDGYGFDSDYNCNNSLFQYNLSYNNEGGFLLLCNSGGWPKDYSVGTNGTIVQYNISINDGIRRKISNKQQGPFSPIIHITGPVKNSLLAHNIIIVRKRKWSDKDNRIICSDNWGGYADSTYFNENVLKVEEPTIMMDSTKSTNNYYYNNKYMGPLVARMNGLSKVRGLGGLKNIIGSREENWEKLIGFIRGKKIVVNGKLQAVIDLIGW